MKIEAYLKQLINANTKTALTTDKEIMPDDLAIKYEALDRTTDNP